VVDGITGERLAPESVTPEDPQLGQSVTVTLAGYLTREQPWEGTPVALWPCRNSRDAASFEELAYGDGSRPLLKWMSPNVEARIAPMREEWAAEVPVIVDTFRRAFAQIAAAGGPSFTLSQDTSTGLEVPGDEELRIVVDPAHECLLADPYYVACTWYWSNGSTITRAEVAFESPRYAGDLMWVIHELGHAVGLGDTTLKKAVMQTAWWDTAVEFHQIELWSLRMMYAHRNPGNLQPDRDPGFAGSSRFGGKMEFRRPAPPGAR
jgi:hypothetical protein